MKRWLLLIVIAILSMVVYVFGLKAAGKNNQPIVFVPKTIDKQIEFWQVVEQGVNAAGAEMGSTVKVVGTDTEKDVDGQIRLLREVIAMKPKAIVLSALDFERTVPIAHEIVKAGIPLITVDSGLKGGISKSFIATDNVEAGKKAGEALIQTLPNRGQVAIINFIKGSSTSIERENGLRSAIQRDTGFQILNTYYSEGSSEKAYDITMQLLKDYPNLQGIVGLNEPSTLGAAKALHDWKKPGEIKLIGFDSSMEEIGFLEEEIIQAMVVQKPFNMGYVALKTAVQLSSGQKVEGRIDTGSEVIWKTNMYTKPNQKLLFPILDKRP
ncbi:substrate-binding domain-containing protein [Paenibacillus chondroitinus]|uniref:Substrate-binding domain-containing protein n=1 Tax=Paenibacillus chondroitinus TaxID=59842 RepID=A0ABU6DFF8_9BACL|nr:MULTISPECIES: substrate-binding domain-containing protein [Paenibacillus]MCY9658733.1 substrate-binding domain-containing protein [Paenibacillus anseongense]MEB4796042.1 substrate-binding domain-containing protein [Paenibacillus chondroitinus]